MFIVETDGSAVTLLLEDGARNLGDLTEAFLGFQAKMVSRVDRTFELAGGPGSGVAGGLDPYREISWSPFAVQRTRVIDGIEVPAWGGVPRVDRKGDLRGRKRPSGKRITAESLLMQDTGKMRQRAVIGWTDVGPDFLSYGPGPTVPYAQEQNERRPFLDLTDSDMDVLELELLDFILGPEEGGL